MFAGLAALAGLAFAATAQAKPAPPTVGMEQVSAPVPGDAPVPITLWYPSASPAQDRTFGPYQLHVAMGGAPLAGRMPLIVMSHGTGGSALDSVRLAMDLAKAGFVVAALEHTGDNYRDRSRSFVRANFLARPLQVGAAIDFLTKAWRHKAAIDPARIGMFGHSAGGTTSLIIGGGRFDWGQVRRYCIENPAIWGCQGGRSVNLAASQAELDPPAIAAADPRVRALVIAAPAMTKGFAPAGLTKPRIPVQLWVAGKDAIVPDSGQVTSLMRARPELHDVTNAGHFSFLAPCSDRLRAQAPAICADPQGFDRSAFQQQFARKIVRFFRRYLRR
jgi:predicted dienelactone hydrolase